MLCLGVKEAYIVLQDIIWFAINFQVISSHLTLMIEYKQQLKSIEK